MSLPDAKPKLKVLLTGGGGRIGKYVVDPLKQAFDLRLFDRTPVYGDPDTFIGTLQDIESLKRAMAGQEVVIHLAATSDVAPFLEELVPNNVVGLYNTLEAAVAQKVRRVVFASSCQAVCRYPIETTITDQMMPAPVSLYGATKVLGEVMGRWYHDKHQLEFVALRIGWFQSYEDAEQNFRNNAQNRGGRSLWLSPRDCVQLLRRATEAPNVGYCIAGGTSLVEHEWLSLEQSREVLGYYPEDDLVKMYGAAPAP